MLDILLYIATSIFLIVLIVGLIKPKKILKKKNRNSRKRVLKIYGSIFLILAIITAFNIYITMKTTTVNYYIREAERLVKEEKYYEALEYYKKAVENWEEGEEYLYTKKEVIKEHNRVWNDLIDAETHFNQVELRNSPHLPGSFHPEF